MHSNSSFVQNVHDTYASIMNDERNPLRILPPAQRFQTMTYLAIMWTTIFCAAAGSWFWYGQLLTAHMLVVLGAFITSAIFSTTERGLLKSSIRVTESSGRDRGTSAPA